MRYGHLGMSNLRQYFFSTVTPMSKLFAASLIGKLHTYSRNPRQDLKHISGLHDNECCISLAASHCNACDEKKSNSSARECGAR